MINKKAIADHYLHGDLLNAIQSSIAQLGKTVDNIVANYIAPVEIISQKSI